MTTEIAAETLPVVTYRRANVAVPEPADNGTILLQQQADALTAYAAEHGYHIINDFSDSASGLSRDREGLAQLLAALTAGPAQGVLVYSLDRITRSLTDMVSFVQTLKQLGARLFVVDKGEVNLDAFLADTPDWLVGTPLDTEPPLEAEED